jgi:predicted aminopeptidase
MHMPRSLLPLLLAALLAGCADTRYYYQSVSGHLQLMQASRPVADWLADPQAPDGLKTRLALAQQIRAFAVTELKLPDNASYQRYADLQRRAVVWNVVAAPEFSLTLKTWCFPVAGCVGYRGYFNEAEARSEAAALQQSGLEVSVYGVPAYSTLGWLNWAGGDPLLNTFIGLTDAELARLIFHELAHQVLYVPDDTRFNESFATAVERLGVQRWLAQPGTETTRREATELTSRRQQFRALTLATRSRLAEIYQSNQAPALDSKGLFAMKNEAMRDFRAAYAELRRSWGGYPGYDAWVAGANNAAFGAQAAYDELVPAFEVLFTREGQDWSRFYAAVRLLAALPAPERARALQQLTLEPGRG